LNDWIFVVGVILFFMVVAFLLNVQQNDLDYECKNFCGGNEARFINGTCMCKYHNMWFNPDNVTTTGTTIK
jgi:hypothetical protein